MKKKMFRPLLKTTLLCSFAFALFTLSSCKDENGDGVSVVPVTAPPTDIEVTYFNNETAHIEFNNAHISQSVFNVKFTNQFGQDTVFEEFVGSPIEITNLPSGQIYSVQMAGGDENKVGIYGEPTVPMLASALEDENNMVRIDMLNAINNARASERVCGTKTMSAVPPLNWDDRLELAARVHSDDMYENNFFDHTSETNGSSPYDRMGDEGYVYSRAGENIHRGSSNAEAAVASWLSSPPHCENIMHPDFKEVGAANAGNYWTQVFGNPR